MPMDISLRKATEADIDFLIALRKQTMHRYLVDVGMPTTEAGYRERVLVDFEHAEIVEHQGEPMGLFKTLYQQEQHRWYVVQIQVAAEYQGYGIGSQLLKMLFAKAAQQNAKVALGVIKTNPAQQLYYRLGFRKVGETDTEYLLEYSPTKD